MDSKVGNLIELRLKNETLEGILMPSKNKKTTLKLRSGYNISIDDKRIISIRTIRKENTKPAKKIVQNNSLPQILLLHTGGTIAAKVSYETGAVSASFSPED